MRFKVDENLPIEVATILKQAGYDAMTINEQGLGGTLDPQVAKTSQSEERAIVTLDLDFSDIRTYPPGDYHGIVVIRPRSQAKPVVLALIHQCCYCWVSKRSLGSSGYCKKTDFGCESEIRKDVTRKWTR